MALKPPDAPALQRVEVEILDRVYRAALAVAVSRGDQLSAVARQIMHRADEPEYAFMLKHLPAADRGPDDTRRKFRFGMPRDQYGEMKALVGAAGQSVARWIEYNLERYADPDKPGKV